MPLELICVITLIGGMALVFGSIAYLSSVYRPPLFIKCIISFLYLVLFSLIGWIVAFNIESTKYEQIAIVAPTMVDSVQVITWVSDNKTHILNLNEHFGRHFPPTGELIAIDKVVTGPYLGLYFNPQKEFKYTIIGYNSGLED